MFKFLVGVLICDGKKSMFPVFVESIIWCREKGFVVVGGVIIVVAVVVVAAAVAAAVVVIT